MLRWLPFAAVLLVPACITAELVPCGELACPPGAVCHGGRCLFPEQLTTCAGRADGTLCEVTAGVGVCASEICIVARCGDGQLDPGEACDDANLVSGDGCREDCLSDETCGNGVRDRDEACDCGAPTSPPSVGCSMTNSDAVEAECDLACSRECGDGVVTGLEQCDGTAISVSCANLGFYTGATSCTSYCALDATACGERCGDDIVQTAFGEECDGAAPPGTSCVDLDMDYGVLGCSSSCAPDTARTCRNFEWRRLLGLGPLLVADVEANARGVIAIDASQIRVIWDQTQTTRANDAGYTTAVASSNVLGMLGPTKLSWFDGTWHHLAVTLPGSLELNPPVITDGGMLLHLDDLCELTRIELATSAITTLPRPSLPTSTAVNCTRLVLADDGRVFTAVQDGDALEFLLRSWDGTSWTTHRDGVYDVMPARAGHLMVQAPGSFEISIANPTTLGRPLQTGYVYDIDGHGASSASVHLIGEYLRPVTLPESAQNGRLRRTRDGAIVYMRFRVHRFDPMPFTMQTFSVDPDIQLVRVRSDQQSALWCGDTIGTTLTGKTSWSLMLHGTCRGIVGDPSGRHLVMAGGLWEYTSGNYVKAPSNIPSLFQSIAGDPNLAFAASLGTGLYQWNGLAWTQAALPTTDGSGCAALAVFGESRIFASAVDFVGPPFAGCDNANSALFEWNRGTMEWDVVAAGGTTSQFRTLTRAANGTLFLHGQGPVAYLDNLDQLVVLATGGEYVAPLSATNYFLHSANGDRAYHHVGTTRYELALPPGPIAVTPDLIYGVDRDSRTLYAIPRMPNRMAAHGL